MKREYRPDFRENDPIFLLRNAKELLLIGEINKNSSSLIYACLDSRIALENLELNIILHSVEKKEREQIIEESKPKNGIERIGRKQGSLKEKYQLFFQAVCEVLEVNAKSFDFKKSKDFQNQLSKYIHSYYFTNDDLKYESQMMQNAIKIVNDVNNFITSFLHVENDTYIIIGMEMKSIPMKDKELLEEWKTSHIMTYEDLKNRLYKNNVNDR